MIEVELVLTAPRKVHALHTLLVLPEGVRSCGDSQQANIYFLVGLDAGERRSLPLKLHCSRWGAYRLGDTMLRSEDAGGFCITDTFMRGEAVLKVYPQPDKLRSLVTPAETQPFAGNRVARAAGDGIEFADVPPYVPGLDLAVRGTATLAQHYLANRDRVGLVSFGGLVSWLAPSSGTRQVYHVVEALLQTEVALSFAWKGVEVLPPRSLTPQALVIALTPLLDDCGIQIVEIVARGAALSL